MWNCFYGCDLSISDISPFTSGIHVYRSAFSITFAWLCYANMPVELSQTYFIFNVLSNYTDALFYHSPIIHGFAILKGLKMGTLYKVDIAVGYPMSKLLWPTVQPIQRIIISTQDTRKFEILHYKCMEWQVKPASCFRWTNWLSILANIAVLREQLKLIFSSLSPVRTYSNYSAWFGVFFRRWLCTDRYPSKLQTLGTMGG